MSAKTTITAPEIFAWLIERGVYVTLGKDRELVVISKCPPKLLERIEANRAKLEEYLQVPYGPDIQCEMVTNLGGQALWRPWRSGEWRVLPPAERRRYWDCRISRSKSGYENNKAAETLAENRIH
jgi:hypothetical protein